MGRPRKALNMQKGNLTVDTKLKKDDEEKSIVVGDEQLAKSPTWLIDEIARKEYRRITKELKKIELVGNLDLNNLVSYCNAYSLYRKATIELNSQPLVIERELVHGGSVPMPNPLIAIQKQYADEMRKFSGLLGMTIDSRLKAATIKCTEKDFMVENEFSGI